MSSFVKLKCLSTLPSLPTVKRLLVEKCSGNLSAGFEEIKSQGKSPSLIGLRLIEIILLLLYLMRALYLTANFICYFVQMFL